MKWIEMVWLLSCFLLMSWVGQSQENLSYKGQLSVYSHYNGNNRYPWWNGGRFIPQLNFQVPLKNSRLIDFEVSANAYGNMSFRSLNDVSTGGRVKPYRMWVRYSTRQLEVRAGLQKINFGSASILRPLMWFDQMDPRDPLQLTDGVWGVLGRFYTLSNITLWGWLLYGMDEPKGWEQIGSYQGLPEAGGRLQLPAWTGEMAFSYHHRTVDSRKLPDASLRYEQVPEHRIGIDARFDKIVGYWVEASWKTMGKKMGVLTNQELVNIGMDYTFDAGNGLYVVLEQLIAAYDEHPFAFNDPFTFTLLNATYPVSLFDNINYIFYYDWRNHSSYNFINWQRQLNRVTLHFMAYRNPVSWQIPTVTGSDMLWGGTGIQIMLVFNY